MSESTPPEGGNQVPQLHEDFETRSRIDLPKRGAYIYAQDPSTEVICLGWAFEEEPVTVWRPGQPFPERVREHYLRCREAAGDPLHPYARSIHAHNAQFERLINWFVLCPDYDLPEPPLEAFYCTAAQARARALPGKLEDLGKALKLNVRKDRRGQELIKLLCVPQEDGTFNRDPGLLEEMYAYCGQDVVVERDAECITPPLTEEEWIDFLVSEKINDRGLHVDVEFCRAAQVYAEPERQAINAEILALTNGQVKTARSFEAVKKWLEPYRADNETIRKATTRVKTDRRTKIEERKITMDKGARHTILSAEEENPGIIAGPVVELVHLLDEAGRSSIAKYKAMELRADEETQRVCGAYMFCGAVQTQRFSSHGAQVHNFVRECSKEPEVVRAEVLAETDLTANKPDQSILDILASMLRPTILAPPGKTLVWGDWSAIEARITPWLSLQNEAQGLLRLFEAGEDVYVYEAAKIYNTVPENIDPEGEERQIGKVAILSLGFGGGVGALLAMARNYKVKLTAETGARIVAAWRESNPWARNFWSAMIKAAKGAVRNPEIYYSAGRITYVCLREPYPVLYAILPDNTTLSYPFIELAMKDGKFGPQETLSSLKANWKPKADEEDWPRVDLWHGTFVENAVQGTAAVLLKRAMRRLENWDWDCIVGHTHDDIMLEVFDDEVDEASAALKSAMLVSEDWMEGLPLAVGVSTGKRLRK